MVTVYPFRRKVEPLSLIRWCAYFDPFPINISGTNRCLIGEVKLIAGKGKKTSTDKSENDF